MDDWRGTDILSQYLLAAELFLDYLAYSEYFWNRKKMQYLWIYCHNICLLRNYVGIIWIILNIFGIAKNCNICVKILCSGKDKRPRLFFSIAV